MKFVVLFSLLLLAACGGPDESDVKGAVPSPTDQGVEGSTFGSRPLTESSAPPFPFWFTPSSLGCVDAECTPEQQTEQNNDPLDGPGILGSSAPLLGPQSQDVNLDESFAEPQVSFRGEYHPIDVKIDWEHE